MEFLEYLRKNKFVVPACTSCGKRAWPPALHCPSCLAKTELRPASKKGTLVEFASSHLRGREGVFGMIEMEDGFRIVGSLSGEKLYKGMKVKMVECGLSPADGAPYYRFSPL